MIKVFTTNKNGKIELTKDELKALLDEAYWDGYKANSSMYVYNSPLSPYKWIVTTSDTALKANDITKGTIATGASSI